MKVALNCTHWALNDGRMEYWKNGTPKASGVEKLLLSKIRTVTNSNIPTFQ